MRTYACVQVLTSCCSGSGVWCSCKLYAGDVEGPSGSRCVVTQLLCMVRVEQGAHPRQPEGQVLPLWHRPLQRTLSSADGGCGVGWVGLG